MDKASATGASTSEAWSRPQRRRPCGADRSCDTCRKRKLKCVKENGQDSCVLCSFHQRKCTYLDEPQRRKRRRLGHAVDKAGATVASADGARNEEASPNRRMRQISAPAEGLPDRSRKSLLDQTLGLHRTTHFKYVGPGSLHEDVLLDIIVRSQNRPGKGSESKLRQVEASTAFLSQPDKQTLFSSDDDEDIEIIEKLVQPHGPSLVDLYFRTVHPSYPILHKGVFLEKYARSYREFSPPLLAAVYLLAMDWWEYDQELSSMEKPDDGALLKAATKALNAVVYRPKLSTLQAGLLLLQRSGGDSWVATSQAVAVAEELGLHVDCSSWNIPAWERGLRRRLAWAIFMQDKWSALIHGRPSHILPSNWRMPQLSLDDFPESAVDEDDKEGSTEVEKGRLLFIHLTRLTEIMAEALETLYGQGRTDTLHLFARSGVQGLLWLVKPIAVKLKEWANKMPPELRLEDVKTRKLCSNGYLHLSYFITEIMVHRFIVRNLTPELLESLHDVCRAAAKARLEHAMEFVNSLRPEHLQAFWWSASPKSLAYIFTYGALLWATSTTDEEANDYKQKLEEFKWSLKVRAKGVSFVTNALRELDECFENLDMSQSPVNQTLNHPTRIRASNLVSEDTTVSTATTAKNQDALGNGVQQCEVLSLQTDPDFSLLDVAAANEDAFFTELDIRDLIYNGTGH